MTGQPSISLPLALVERRPADRHDVHRPLRRRGDAVPPRRPAGEGSALEGPPPADLELASRAGGRATGKPPRRRRRRARPPGSGRAEGGQQDEAGKGGDEVGGGQHRARPDWVVQGRGQDADDRGIGAAHGGLRQGRVRNGPRTARPPSGSTARKEDRHQAETRRRPPGAPSSWSHPGRRAKANSGPGSAWAAP